MKNIYTLSLKDLKSNKKMTITIIISIIVVTILINSITTLALSYQEYMINLSRSKENWEAMFDNIKYENIKYLSEDKNIEQIFIVQDLGQHKFNCTYNNYDNILLHIKAYDYNAMQNLHFSLETGRLPQNSSEIVVNINSGFKIGDTIIDTTLNNKTFTVVGKVWLFDWDEYGGITICNKENINLQENVSMYIITNDVSQIYKCTNRIIENLKSNEPNSNINIKYNEELLSYACVAENGSSFQNTIIVIVRFTNSNNSNIFNCINI